MKDPLLGPLAAIASGILVSRFVPFNKIELLEVMAAFAALSVVCVLRRSRVLAAVCAGIGLLATGAWIALLHTPAPAPELDVTGREVVILGGCVVEPPAMSGERERFVLELDTHARAQVTLYTKEGETLPPLAYGQNIELEARVRSPRNYGNPGAFDYEHYLARKDIYWTASGAAGTVRVLPGRCGSRFQKAVMGVRAAMLDRINRLYQREPYRTGMMQAMLVGQNYQLQKVWTADYRSTGTFHALVISGTHVAILAAFFLFLLRLCFVPETIALFGTALAAWFYAVMTGWQAPCTRSAAGLTLLLACGYLYRRRRALNALAAVAIGFLIVDPGQLFEASFQLTFLAVAFLGAFAVPLVQATSGPLARGLDALGERDRDPHLQPRVAQFRIEMRLLAEALRVPLRAIAWPARFTFFVYEMVVTSAIIQLGLALPMIVYFHRVGISGLSANAFVVPLLGIFVPLGFVAVATGWVWVAKIAAALLWLSERVVHWHAAIEPDWRIPTPPLWLAIAFSLALIAAAAARGRWGRIATVATLAVLLALLLWEPFAPQRWPGNLEMTTIDVGQGDSILVVFPDGKRLLMDGGGIPAFGHNQRSQLDTGEDVVAPYLWSRRFRSVDVVALSHAHEDHIGGLSALVDDFHPRELWTGAVPESPLWDNLRHHATAHGAKIVPQSAPANFHFGGAEIDVLAPLSDYVPADTPKNNDSLVLRIRYGRHAFLLCGDAERPIERRMMDENELQHNDVLKVAHHGSRTSSTEEFLDLVQPQFAVISAGFQNSYGHPNRDVLDRLAEHHAMILRTDQDGLVTIRSDGRRLYLETNRDHAGELLSPALFP